MITFRTLGGGLGVNLAIGSRYPGLQPGLPLGANVAAQAAAAAGAAAGGACSDARLTTDRQRSFCMESAQAGLSGDTLIVNALAKDACATAVDQGLVPVESQTTCVQCASASMQGQFDASQIPACVSAGGPGAASGVGAESFVSKYKWPLLIGGALLAGVGVWAVVR